MYVAPPLCGFDVAIDGADVAARVVEVAELRMACVRAASGGHAERDERVDAHVDVKAKLLVDVARGSGARCATGARRVRLRRALTPAPAL